jgi:hypothetical protein
VQFLCGIVGISAESNPSHFSMMESRNETGPIEVDDSDDEDSIEEEQLAEYREMVQNLGVFPVSSFVGNVAM